MNLKDRREGYMRELGEKKGKGGYLYFNYNLKTKI